MNSLLELIDGRLLLGNACFSAAANINTVTVRHRDMMKFARKNQAARAAANQGEVIKAERKPPVLNESEAKIRDVMRAVK